MVILGVASHFKLVGLSDNSFKVASLRARKILATFNGDNRRIENQLRQRESSIVCNR